MPPQTELNLFNNRLKIDKDGNFRAVGSFHATKPINFMSPIDETLFNMFVSGLGEQPAALPPAFDNTLVIDTAGLDNANFMEIMLWDSETGRPAFVLNEGAPNRGSVFERSLIVGAQKGLKTLDGDYTAGDDFENLNFNTLMYGADLGVENNVEVKGQIYCDQLDESTPGAGVSINENFKVVDGEVYIINLAGQGNKPIQVDNDGRLFTLP